MNYNIQRCLKKIGVDGAGPPNITCKTMVLLFGISGAFISILFSPVLTYLQRRWTTERAGGGQTSALLMQPSRCCRREVALPLGLEGGTATPQQPPCGAPAPARGTSGAGGRGGWQASLPAGWRSRRGPCRYGNGRPGRESPWGGLA